MVRVKPIPDDEREWYSFKAHGWAFILSMPGASCGMTLEEAKHLRDELNRLIEKEGEI